MTQIAPLHPPQTDGADRSISVRDGLTMHYIDAGSGPPVVMVHGNPTWSFYYRSLVARLSNRYRTVVPDHIGMGRSDKPPADAYGYTLDDRIADLGTLIRSLDLDEPLTLIVHDWGGMIGMGWAVDHPEQVARIVVLNTGAFRLPPAKQLPWSLRVVRNTPFGPFLVRGLNGFCRGGVRYCVTRNPMSPDVARGYLAPYDSWKNRLGVLRFVQDIPLKPGDPSYETVVRTEERLEQLRDKPMLICWGEQDFVFDEHFLQEWIRRFPDADVHRFPDCGHYILEDAPEEVGELVERFLGPDAI